MARAPRTSPDRNAPYSESKNRRADEKKQEKKVERASRENRNFVQIYPQGWLRLQNLMSKAPHAAKLYILLAENIDGKGAVIATQGVLAELLGVSSKSIQRYSALLEKEKALVRIPLQGGVYAYALNPEEVWKAYDKQKEYAAFNTRTLVSARGFGADLVRGKLQVMMKERRSA